MIKNLDQVKKIYFIGIKGVALSGLAVICRQRGMAVFGSDVADKFITDKVLAQQNIEVFEEFSAANLDVGPDLVVVGASWPDDHVEVATANTRHLPTISDSELRGLLSREKTTVAVTGVHGKTTTTALISYVLTKAGLAPSYLIGTCVVADLGNNAQWNATSDYFVVEGDEYIRSQTDHTPKFLDLSPTISVITSIEWEHVDVFPNVEALETAFTQLVENTKDTIVACGDWSSVQKVIAAEKDKTITYGLESVNDWQLYDIKQEFEGTVFKVRRGQDSLGEFSISLFGQHNALNALSAIIIGVEVGIDLELIRQMLPGFKGAERRFDVSERHDVVFIDDYAHHPTAIKTTLQAVRHRYPDKKIWCVFQPHMASRTKALLDDFAQSFSDVDMVLFADIFASAREKVEDFSSKNLAEQTIRHHQHALYTGDLNQTIEYVKKNIQSGMVLVTMGAGDVYRVRDKVIKDYV